MININTTNNDRESKILFHQIRYLANTNNVFISDLELSNTVNSKQFKLSLNNLDNTLLLQGNNNDFKLLIHNVTVDTFRKCRAIAKLRCLVDSIPMK
ncbi:TPA: hypothetical protein OLZ61_004127 [Clostridioides difficile]|nr:hypothetical protein [Clostridioides difficile]HCQ5778362.1 hypothetical protein [Clostridioides difficile]HCQ5958641.1 hypothetical protein [Clostridioides difficile]